MPSISNRILTVELTYRMYMYVMYKADTVRTALIRFEPNYKGERSAFHPTLFDSFLIENVTCKQSNECGIYMAGLQNVSSEHCIEKRNNR